MGDAEPVPTALEGSRVGRERKSHTGGYTVSQGWWQKSVQELTRTKGGGGRFYQGVREGPPGGLEVMLPQQTRQGGQIQAEAVAKCGGRPKK